jgi:hypothetical protein
LVNSSPCIIEIDNVAPVLKENKPLFKPRNSHSVDIFRAVRSKAYYPFLFVWRGERGEHWLLPLPNCRLFLLSATASSFGLSDFLEGKAKMFPAI